MSNLLPIVMLPPDKPEQFHSPDDAIYSAKIQLLMALRTAGIRDHTLLGAIETVPREACVPRLFSERAYENTDLPISAGQRILSPETTAMMLQALEVEERNIVLEIGTGSGYQTAILSKLARRVLSLEYYHDLREEARKTLESLDCRNVTLLVGDGHKGWREAAPFDRIIVSAALRAVPGALLEQLADQGRLIAPVGQPGQPQKILSITRDKWNFRTTTIGEQLFDPMIEPHKPEE